MEGAVYQAAPDAVSLAIEGGEDKQGFVPLEMLQGKVVSNGHATAAAEKGAL